MVILELRNLTEGSDGVWRGTGHPVFVGSQAQTTIWLAGAGVNGGPYEIEAVTYKKGKIVKREIR